jgi:hypothetical protein
MREFKGTSGKVEENWTRNGDRISAVGKRKITFQVEQDIYEQVRQAAEAEQRSLGNWLAVIVGRVVQGETSERQES